MQAAFCCIVVILLSVLAGQDGQDDEKTSVSQTPRCYEGFDYLPAEGVLLGRSGGEGFEGAWIPAGFNARNPEAYRIIPGSLAASGLPPGTSHVRTEASPTIERQFPFEGFPGTITYQPIKGIGRRLADPIEADETTTLYIAALLRPEQAVGEDLFGGYVGFYLDGTGNNDLFVGVGGTNQPNYCLENRGGDGQVISEHIAEAGRTDLLVVKAEFRPGPDVFTLYVNPDPRAPEPLSGTVKRDLDLGRVDQLVLYSTGAFSIDEFRIVDSFSALADYPSPDELQQIRRLREETNHKDQGDDCR